MKNKTTKQRRPSPKRVLRLPDLDYAKTAVLNTLSSSDSRRSYRFAIDDFVTWYCSEPRLAFGKTVVLRYRLELIWPRPRSTCASLRFAASRMKQPTPGSSAPELTAGILRVKGVKSKGVRVGNWLSLRQAQVLLSAPDVTAVRGLRDCAILAVLLGCGLRRSEAAALTFAHLRQLDGRWCIVDLLGKHGPGPHSTDAWPG
jgi:integrase